MAVKVISHVLINSETVKEVNNLTEEDNVFTRLVFVQFFKRFLMQTLSPFYLILLQEKNDENKLKYFVLAL